MFLRNENEDFKKISEFVFMPIEGFKNVKDGADC